MRYKAFENRTYQIAKRAVNSGKEIKFFYDNTRNDTTAPEQVDADGTVWQLNVVPRGTTTFERVGNEVSNRYLVVRALMARNTNVLNQAFRIIIFVYKKPNSGTITALDYFGNNRNAQSEKAPLDYFNTKTLYDRTWNLGETARGQINAVIKIPLKNMLTRWSTTDSTGATVEDNGIYLLAISNNDPATPANDPTFNFHSALWYKDK